MFSLVIPLTSKDTKTFETFLNVSLPYYIKDNFNNFHIIVITSYEDMLRVINHHNYVQNSIVFKIDDRFNCNITTNWKVVNNLLKFYCWSEIPTEYYVVINGDYLVPKEELLKIEKMVKNNTAPFYTINRDEILNDSDFVNEEGYGYTLAYTKKVFDVQGPIYLANLPSRKMQVLKKKNVQEMLSKYDLLKNFADVDFFFVYRMSLLSQNDAINAYVNSILN